MISIENRTAFAKAEAKAREIKPRVTTVHFGEYQVAGSQAGTSYTVQFKKDNGHWVASCTCPAHVADGRPDYTPKPCYHLPAAYSVHAAEVYRRVQERDRLGLPVCGCGNPGYAYLRGLWYCISCVEMMAEAEAEEEEREQARCKQCNSYLATNADGLCEWCSTTANAIEAEAEQDAVYTMEQEAKDKADIFG